MLELLRFTAFMVSSGVTEKSTGNLMHSFANSRKRKNFFPIIEFGREADNDFYFVLSRDEIIERDIFVSQPLLNYTVFLCCQ